MSAGESQRTCPPAQERASSLGTPASCLDNDQQRDHSDPHPTPGVHEHHMQVREAADALHPFAEPGDSVLRRHLVEMLSQEDIDRREMDKGVRVTYVGQEFSNINYLVRHKVQNGAVYHYPSNQLPRRYTTHELDRIPTEAFMLPPRATVDELLSQYFLHINPGCPIVDERSFMSQYRARDPDDPPSLLLLQSILLVGAHVARDRPERDELKAAFFRRAKMLFDARFEWNLDSMVQAALLMTWHSEAMEDVGANAYHWIGVAVRTAFGLGMHRNCSPSILGTVEKRVWRRLWWILVQHDAMVALSTGRPLAIDLADCDVPPLDRADFEDAVVCIEAESAEQAIDFVMHQTKLCCIIAQVIREIFGLRVVKDQRKVALRRADQLLAEWQFQLPPSLKHGSSYRSTWSAMLHVTYSNLLILLHRPAPRPVSNTSTVKPEDIEICSLAGSSMVGLFETVERRGQLGHFNVFAVAALFTGLIQLSAEMRVANPVLIANAIRRFDTALDVLKSLANWWLNADMILRLFEESSERLTNELRLGRRSLHIPLGLRSAPHHRSGPEPPAGQQSTFDGQVSGEQVSSWDSFLLGQATLGMSGLGGTLGTTPEMEALDWTNIYWQNEALLDIAAQMP